MARKPDSIATLSARNRRESGQVLIIVALAAIVMFGITGLAIDVGRLYVTKAELARAVDAAALAGVLELNGTPAGETNACTKANAFMAANEPAVIPGCTVPGENQLQITGTKSVNTYFLSVLGVTSTSVSAHAKAGFGIQPVDAYITIDATGSMHNGCNASETDTGGVCPIKEAKDGAVNFVDTLLGASPSGNTVIGIGAFRGCYNLPRNNVKCIDSTAPGSMIMGLSSNESALQTGISNIHAIRGPGQPTGGSGTNICLALKKGQEVLMPPAAGAHTASNTRRFLIVLTDGDNVYNATEVNQASPQSPEDPCRPTSPTTSDADISPNCRTASDTVQARKVDVLSKDMAVTLKGQGVEIYVIGLSPCAHDTTLCDLTKFGTALNDAGRNENLMKCIASSTPGTNDHYYYTTVAADLPAIFTAIAQHIAHRLIE